VYVKCNKNTDLSGADLQVALKATVARRRVDVDSASIRKQVAQLSSCMVG